MAGKLFLFGIVHHTFFAERISQPAAKIFKI